MRGPIRFFSRPARSCASRYTQKPSPSAANFPTACFPPQARNWNFCREPNPLVRQANQKLNRSRRLFVLARPRHGFRHLSLKLIFVTPLFTGVKARVHPGF